MTKRASAQAIGKVSTTSIHWPHEQPALQEVQDRLMFSQVLEAVRALEEGVLEDIREGDVGAILGWGFAPATGGPFSYLDIIGTPYAAERCDQLQAEVRRSFRVPCPSARDGG